MLNTDEKNALRYYIGDVSDSDPFRGDPKAYVLLNALFFDGIETEAARAAEGKRLNPAILADIPRLMDFFSALLPAFCRHTVSSPTTVYRVERLSDYELCRRRGETVSLTSTSTAGYLSSYRDRRGIALMRFELKNGDPCLNIGELLDFYAKPEEAEILLPPFLRMEFEEVELSAAERQITDCDNAPPQVSVIARPQGFSAPTAAMELPEDGAAAGQRVCSALNAGKMPSQEDIRLYTEWKSVLRANLRSMMEK